MADEIDKSKPGWWAKKQEANKPKTLKPVIKTKVDKILEKVEIIEKNTRPERQLEAIERIDKNLNFITNYLKFIIAVAIGVLLIYLFTLLP